MLDEFSPAFFIYKLYTIVWRKIEEDSSAVFASCAFIVV